MALQKENDHRDEHRPTTHSVLGGGEEKDDGDVGATETDSATSDTFCSLCLESKELAEMQGQSRCKLCSRLRLRIVRVGGDSEGVDGKSALDTFADLCLEARATFYKENAHKFKQDLRGGIETVVKQVSTNSVEFGWVGTGDLLDSPDLAKKYQHNPIRLNATKAKARQVIYPSTNIRMYEDLKIVTHAGENNKRAREESETISQHRSESCGQEKKQRKQ